MPKQQTGCRKVGCFGCFGCLALLMIMLVISAVIFAIAWSRARNETIDRRVVTQPLSAGGKLIIEGPLAIEEDGRTEKSAGTVTLDLEGTTFHIRPAARGEDLRVEAAFDSKTYSLTEEYQEARDDEGWTYRLQFQRTSRSYALTTLKELISGNRPDVAIFLPRDLPFDLILRVRQGGTDLDLGGLHLLIADLDFSQGGGSVEFSEPLEVPMESLFINFSQGGGAVAKVGNASPQRLEVAIAMGGGFVGLGGAWRNDAEISLRQKMGGMTVELPRDAVIQGLPRHGLTPPAVGEVPLPTLRFSTSAQYGEIEILD